VVAALQELAATAKQARLLPIRSFVVR
jgi:hypothetical protein